MRLPASFRSPAASSCCDGPCLTLTTAVAPGAKRGAGPPAHSVGPALRVHSIMMRRLAPMLGSLSRGETSAAIVRQEGGGPLARLLHASGRVADSDCHRMHTACHRKHRRHRRLRVPRHWQADCDCAFVSAIKFGEMRQFHALKRNRDGHQLELSVTQLAGGSIIIAMRAASSAFQSPAEH